MPPKKLKLFFDVRQELIREVHGLVSEQGVEMKSVEADVTRAQERVGRGADDLAAAADFDRRAKRKEYFGCCALCCWGSDAW